MIGNYFKTGKTIVIDDVYEQAVPLLNSLYRHQIPHYYSDGGINSKFPLPKNKLHFRLVFLDLNLKPQLSAGGSGGDDFKNFKAHHLNIIDKILKNENHSYVLVIWSRDEDKYLEEFKKIFDQKERYSTHKKPYKIIPLDKAAFFSEGQFKKDKEKELFEKIEVELKKLDTFKVFCAWEGKVNESAGETIDSILQTANNFEEENKESYLSKLITLLSIAYSGNDGFLGSSNDQMKTDSVLLALNEILDDDLDRLILNNREEEYENWKANNTEQIDTLRNQIDAGPINTKLFTYKPNRPELTGSLYGVRRSNTIKKIFDDAANFGAIASRQKGVFKSQNNNQGPNSDELERLVGEHYKFLYSSILPIELNITPLCDVSQGKDKKHRILPGFIISEKNRKMIKTNNRFSLNTKEFDISGLNERIKLKGNVFIYFDMRYFTSISKSEVQSRAIGKKTLPRYLFTLRSNLVNDLQISVSNHVSRLGVLSL